MTEPSKEAVEHQRLIVELKEKAPSFNAFVAGTLMRKAAKALEEDQKARQRWEQEVRERLLSDELAVKVEDTLLDHIAGSTSALTDELIALVRGSIFGEAEPQGKAQGHVCDPERPCEPNDHLCKNYLSSGEAEPVEEVEERG